MQYACADGWQGIASSPDALGGLPERGASVASGSGHGDLADPLLPLARTGLMDRGPHRVDRNRHRHILDLELVDRFHAEIGEGDYARMLDRLGNEVGGAADRHQVCSAVLFDRIDGDGAALGFSY